jgi:prefoldin subunit 5
MPRTVRNCATICVADRTDVSGRVTAESIKHGLWAKKRTSLWRLAIFGCAVSVSVLASLAPMSVSAQGVPGEIAALQAQVTALQSAVSALQTANTTLQSQVNTQQGQITTLQGQAGSLQTANTTLQGQVTTLQNQLTAAQPVLTLAPFVSVDPNPEMRRFPKTRYTSSLT